MVTEKATTSKTSLVRVYLTSFCAIVLWGLSYIWSDKLILMNIPVEYFVFVRVLIAGLILLCVNLVLRLNLKIRKKDLPMFFLLALLEPLVYFICETYGIRLTKSPTYSALIIAATPIFSVIPGVLIFKEKFSVVNMLGILVCLWGIVIVTLCAESIGDKFFWGVLFLVLAIFSEVGHASCTKVLTNNNYRPQVIVMYQFLIGAAYFLPLFLTRGLRNYDAAIYMSWGVWGPILCLAVFCSSISFSLWGGTIKQLGVAKSSIFLSMIPVVTAIADSLTGGIGLKPLQWVGVLIACLGIILSQLLNSKNYSKNRMEV